MSHFKKRTLRTSVVIIGAGPAGIAASLALREANLGVSLIEKSDFSGARVGEHLAAEARAAFAGLGVSNDKWLEGASVNCSTVRSAWVDSTPIDQDSIFNPHGEGLLLSRPLFDGRFADIAEERGVVLYRKTLLRRAERSEEGWLLWLDCGGQSFSVRTDFLVDATGRRAYAASVLGASRQGHDKLVGIVGSATPAGPASTGNHFVQIEACQDGWWYSARLKSGQLVATFMTDSDILARSRLSPLEFFNAKLERATLTANRLKDFEVIRKVGVRSARSQRLNPISGDSWLAVGDAAISFDPLSSEGILKGLNMGMRAASAIASHFDGNQDALAHYDQRTTAEFEAYRRKRAYYYGLVTRWPESKFWSRRQKVKPPVVKIFCPSQLIDRVDFASDFRVE